jgi:hypothetical protein
MNYIANKEFSNQERKRVNELAYRYKNFVFKPRKKENVQMN